MNSVNSVSEVCCCHNNSPTRGLSCLIVGVSASHTQARTRGRTHLNKWSARHRGNYPHYTQQTEQPCPQRDWKPRSQQSSRFRPTPSTARPPGSAMCLYSTTILKLFIPCTFCQCIRRTVPTECTVFNMYE